MNKILIMGVWGITLSSFARVIDLPKAGETPETTDLVAEVAAAKTDYDTSGSAYYHDPVTIRLAAGDYTIGSEIIANWPLVIGGTTGDPDDVNIVVESKFDGSGARQTARAFAVNNADAMVHSLTVRNGYFISTSTYNVSTKAQGLGVVRICGLSDSGVEWASKAGEGGIVSNVVITASAVGDKSSGCGLLYVCAPDGVVTHCRVVGNAGKRSRGTSAANQGLFVVVNYGTVRNTLIADNEVDSVKTSSHPSGCYGIASVLANGTMVNCTVTGNRCVPSGGSDTYGDGAINACAGVIALGKVVNTLIYGNTTSSQQAHYSSWSGTGANILSAAGDYAAADAPSESCLVLKASPFVAADDYRPDKTSSCCGAGTLSTDYVYGETDLAGAPRTYVDGGVEKIDIGAYQHSLKVLNAVCTFTGPRYDRVPTHLVATVDAGALGDQPVYYWDWDSDGTTDFTTTSAEIDHTFGLGSYHLTVCASNAQGTAGYSFTFEEGLVVVPHPVHLVDSASANPAPPYTTAETAAHSIQEAVDVALPGAVVEITAGTYEITRSLYLVTDYVTLRGATGKPGDVIVRPADGSYCRCLCVDAGPHALVCGLTLEAGRGGSGDSDNRPNGGGGACLNICAMEQNGETDSPAAGLGGVVSNCVIRSGRFGAYADGGGTGSRSRYRSGGAYLCGVQALLTHTVISNCVNNSSMSSAGDGYWTGASALSLWEGARAENCLIAKNQCTSLAVWQSTVTVGTNAVLRYSTVVGNTGRTVGGVGVAEGGRFEKCVIADNDIVLSTTGTSTLARRKVWGSLAYGRDDTYSGFADYTAEAAQAAAVGADQTDDASTLADAGLGSGYVTGALVQLFSDYANGDFVPPKMSPVCDKIVPADEKSPMPARDLLGRHRLSGRGYDLGAYERQAKGLVLSIQ